MDTLKFAFAMIYKPLTVIRAVKQNRGTIRALPALLLIVLLPVVRILYLYTVHYPLATSDVMNINMLVEIALSLTPILSFIVASFMITSINEGELLFSEAFILGAYCLMPYLIFTVPMIGLSWLWSASMLSIYNTLNTLILVWSVILTFVVIKETNDYPFFKAIVIYIIIIITILLLWVVLLLIYAMMNQVWVFLLGLVNEISGKIGIS